MIINALLSVVKVLINILFGWVQLPAVPESITSVVDTVFSYMQQGIGIVWLFVPQGLVQVLLPLVIVVHNFDHLYHLGMWILKKIPMLGIE